MTLTPTQRRILQAMRDGAQLVGMILWRTGGKRDWNLWTVNERGRWLHTGEVRAQSVQGLERRGLIEKVPSREVARKLFILTPAGAAALEGQG